MKKTIRLIIAALFIAQGILLTSCGNAEEKKNLERCDQIAASLDSTGKKLLEANDDTLRKKFLLFKEASEQLEQNFYTIKTDENFGDICSYRECKKPLKNLVSNYKVFQKEVDTSAVQVQRLKHDIKEDLLSKDEITQFIAIEEANAKGLAKKISKIVDDALQYEKRFDTLHPRILEYIRQAKPKK